MFYKQHHIWWSPEREKLYKAKEVESIHARSEIIRLKAKISNLETANQQARIEMEQQLEKAMTEKLVRYIKYW